MNQNPKRETKTLDWTLEPKTKNLVETNQNWERGSGTQHEESAG